MASKCVVVGDVNGHFVEVFNKIANLHTKNAFSLAIIAGNLFAEPESEGDNGDRDLDELLEGRVEVALPTYFALGKSALPQKVIERLDNNKGEICENLYFLGKRFTVNTSEGIRIVALGGALDLDLAVNASKDRYTPFHSNGDAKTLRGAKTADILLTSDWPKNIFLGSSVDKGSLGSVLEQEEVADLCTALKPRYHFTTNSSSFFEREPFFHPPAEDSTNEGYRITRFISLAPFGNVAKQKWIYAFSLDPKASAPVVIPPGTTASPLTFNHKKRPNPSLEPFSRYDTSKSHNSRHQSKRQRQKQPPPGPEACFFCLSNPNVATHLVTSIGMDAYMTTAKGPLSSPTTFAANGLSCAAHMLIIPLPHDPTLASISDPSARSSTMAEMHRFRHAAQDMLSSVGDQTLGMATWEVARSQGVHAHWQMLPVPVELIRKGLVETAFRVEAENEHYPGIGKRRLGPYTNDKEGQGKRDADDAELAAEIDCFRVWIWAPPQKGDEGAKASEIYLSLPLFPSFRFDLQFGRRVLAKLLGLEDRTNWRDCGQTEDEETADAESWKKTFGSGGWDFTLDDD